MTQPPLFDLEAGKKARDKGKEVAAWNRRTLLDAAREWAEAMAHDKPHGITADHVMVRLSAVGYDISGFGNAAGSIFKGSQWECIGWEPSRRVSNHGRAIRVWRLKK